MSSKPIIDGFKKRLIKEISDLKLKTNKLCEFINSSPIFLKLGSLERAKLASQLNSMEHYLSVLNDRAAEIFCDQVEFPKMPNKVEKSHIDSMIDSLEFKFARVENTTVTGCWAFLPNGFQVGYGESACVDPADYKWEDGCKYAKERCVQQAVNKLWELEGYLLKMTGATSDYL